MSGAFDEFYAANFASVVVQLRAATGDLAEAQDLAQEAFSRAWGRWDRLATYEDPVAWVRRVAWNLAVNRWRRARTAWSFLARQRAEHVDGPEPDRVALHEALRRLPIQQRRAVALFYLADLSTAQIAEDCAVPESTVRSWLHRARAALHEQLTDSKEEGDRGTVR
jgi:RNA polymerase sigma-70 factor (ECF subfamily)